MEAIKLHVDLTKRQHFLRSFCSLIFQFSSSKFWKSWICSFHKHSGLISFMLTSVILDFPLTYSEIHDGRSKIADQIVSSFRACSGLSNQCVFISLCLSRTKTKMGGGRAVHEPLSHCTTLGEWVSLYVRWLTLITNSGSPWNSREASNRRSSWPHNWTCGSIISHKWSYYFKKSAIINFITYLRFP